MQFLTINSLDDLLPFVEEKKEIHVRTTEDGFTTVIYRFMDSNTFDTIESLEARGIMFDDLGTVISRPLHKFHNLNATHSGINSYTKEYILANKDKVAAIFEKLDGSMISTANYHGQVRLRSKGTFDSDVVKLAQKIYDADPAIQYFCEMCIRENWTATFELTHPEARIVLDYKQPQLRLLHVRNNVTGSYLYGHLPDIEYCPQVPLSWLETILSDEHLENLKDKEGYVIQFKDGDMVKIKCPWYVSLHKTVTFVRKRDIVELVLNETLDDVYEAFEKLGIDTKKVQEIEHKVVQELIEIEQAVEKLHNATKDLERKEVALEYCNNLYFGMMMSMRDGKEIKTKEWYRKNILKTWSLQAVDNIGEKE